MTEDTYSTSTRILSCNILIAARWADKCDATVKRDEKGPTPGQRMRTGCAACAALGCPVDGDALCLSRLYIERCFQEDSAGLPVTNLECGLIRLQRQLVLPLQADLVRLQQE